MIIDAYSLCPGGTGKKIKFCCNDLLSDLQKIGRMLEGEQYLGCLQHIENLGAAAGQRRCLLAIKARLLRLTGQTEAAEAHVARFVEQCPDSTVAWAESAIVTAGREGGRAAMPALLRALDQSDKEMEVRVYEAMGAVAEALVDDGEWLPARALLQLQAIMAPKDPHPVEMLIALNRSNDLPLLVKDEQPLAPAPEDAPWKARLAEALAPLAMAHWQKAAQRLTALAAELPDEPAVWRNLAIVCSWTADDAGCREALGRFAALDVPLEDAVEAEALALILAEDPLGDAMDGLLLTWTVRDADRLQEALLSDRRVIQVPFDPADMATADVPPPKSIGVLLDQPLPETAAGLTLESVPRFLAQVMLFGRQTDREARLEVVMVTAWTVEEVKTALRNLGGEALDGEPQSKVVGRISQSRALVQRQWQLPRDVSREQIGSLTVQHLRRALLEKWPQLPLAYFGGRSPGEAAADPAQRVKLLAAIFWLQDGLDHAGKDFDFNELRGRLGLPLLGPIDPEQFPLEKLPLVRLERVIAEKLSDDDLLLGFRRALSFAAHEALRQFARAMAERPSFAERPERAAAYRVLAQTAENFQEALGHVEQGRAAARAAGQSCASWDLLDLAFRFGHGDGREAMRLIRHIETQHIEEPHVADELTRILIEVGILRPDGTPAMPHPRQEAPTAEQAASPGKIWTPGDQEPGEGGGKIWTPG